MILLSFFMLNVVAKFVFNNFYHQTNSESLTSQKSKHKAVFFSKLWVVKKSVRTETTLKKVTKLTRNVNYYLT